MKLQITLNMMSRIVRYYNYVFGNIWLSMMIKDNNNGDGIYTDSIIDTGE